MNINWNSPMWHILLIAVLLVAGGLAHDMSGKPDSEAEQVIEEILHFEGIDIDFSGAEKHELLKEEANEAIHRATTIVD
jgi:hypothetical protein